MKFTSLDGEWAVESVALNGAELLRITCASLTNAPVIYDDGRRAGICKMARGYLVADVTSVAEVARYVALDELVEA